MIGTVYTCCMHTFPLDCLSAKATQRNERDKEKKREVHVIIKSLIVIFSILLNEYLNSSFCFEIYKKKTTYFDYITAKLFKKKKKIILISLKCVVCCALRYLRIIINNWKYSILSNTHHNRMTRGNTGAKKNKKCPKTISVNLENNNNSDMTTTKLTTGEKRKEVFH